MYNGIGNEVNWIFIELCEIFETEKKRFINIKLIFVKISKDEYPFNNLRIKAECKKKHLKLKFVFQKKKIPKIFFPILKFIFAKPDDSFKIKSEKF